MAPKKNGVEIVKKAPGQPTPGKKDLPGAGRRVGFEQYPVKKAPGSKRTPPGLRQF